MPRTTAKDFFLNLGTMIALYVGATALINLLFSVINARFPQVLSYGYYYQPSISFPVATLIVAFPLFIILSRVLRKIYEVEPERKEVGIRKWLLYITIFVSGAILAGDLVTLIYYFLDGRDLTTTFVLKVLAVILVAGGIFAYYLEELRNRLTPTKLKLWRIGSAVLVLGSVIWGFSIIGSPATQRAIRIDNERVMDLQNLQSQLPYYYQQKGALPATLNELNDSLRGFSVPTDPATGAEYEYKKENDLSFTLCANFARPSPKAMRNDRSFAEPAYYGGIKGGPDTNWQHEAGRQCFTKTIDPDFFPRPRD